MNHAQQETCLDKLRRKDCCWCGSHLVHPFFVIELEKRSKTEYWHTIVVLCDDCKRGQLERTYSDTSDWEKTFEQTEWYMLEESSMNHLLDYVQQKPRRFAPCPEPLSPKCLCEVHWRLSEATERLESLSDAEMQKSGSMVVSTFGLIDAGMPRFERSRG